MKVFLIHTVGGLCLLYCLHVVAADKYGVIAVIGSLTYVGWIINRMLNPGED